MEEIWKDVLGYEGLYQVSNKGRVRSLNYNKTGEVKLLQLREEKKHMRVQLWHKGKLKFAAVHRIEYEAFYGPIPPGMQVNHINEDGTDNRLENLNLMTPKENTNWGTGIARCARARYNTKAFNSRAKTVVQYDLEGNVIREWSSQKEIQRELGFAQRNISTACRGGIKTAYNYIWRFKEC